MHTNIALTLMVVLPMAALIGAQRAGYAGSRPNGLSQKDKYHGVDSNGNIVFSERFGEPVVNNIAFGASQRPPIGYPIVAPQSSFVPVATGATAATQPPQQQVPQQQSPQPQLVTFQNRIGGNDSQAAAGLGGTVGGATSAVPLAFAAGSAVANAAALPQTTQRPSLPLPIDAGGDQLLIQQLSLLPEEKRPFWFLNWQAIEAQRNGTGSNFAGALGGRGSFAG